LPAAEPAARLQVPRARRTSPAVPRQDQALAAMAAADRGAQERDPMALRGRLIVASGLAAAQVLGPLAMLEIGGLVQRQEGRWRLTRGT